MPSKKALDGEYRDIAHPINSGTRERIQNIILEKYEEALAEDAAEAQSVSNEYIGGTERSAQGICAVKSSPLLYGICIGKKGVNREVNVNKLR